MSKRTPKYLIRKALRSTGLDVVRFRGDLEDLQARLLREEGIGLVLDVGANEGQYSQRLRQIGYSGRIEAFEPIQSVFQKLTTNFAADRQFIAHNQAVGESTGELELHVSANTVSSSTLTMNDLHLAADPRSQYVGTEIVPIVRLDSTVWPETNMWLKVDVQGAELQVLRGAAGFMNRVRVLQLELSLDRLYEEAPLVEEVLTFARGSGYTPVYLAPGFQDPKSGRMLQAEGLFARLS